MLNNYYNDALEVVKLWVGIKYQIQGETPLKFLTKLDQIRQKTIINELKGPHGQYISLIEDILDQTQIIYKDLHKRIQSRKLTTIMISYQHSLQIIYAT